MRLLTFSFLRICKTKSIFHLLPRYNSDNRQHLINCETFPDQSELVEIQDSWPKDVETDLRAAVLRDMRVLPNFMSEEEETAMIAELEPRLKRMRYEFDHWDNAIQGYRETERTTWSPGNEAVLSRVKAVAFSEPGSGQPLPHTHILDLAADGHIRPHIDAVRFCGEVIAGLCLVSPAVMRLEHSADTRLAVHALLPQRGLYIMRGVARYSFTHAVLSDEQSVWRNQRLPRQRRVAVITRSQPERHD